jgi:hypothetical protein
MARGKPYNGHRSWNAWNVSLWLNNDEGLYRAMQDYKRRYKTRRRAAAAMARDMAGERTPDGGRYNPTTIYEAMED